MITKIKLKGLTFRVEAEHDPTMREPWKEHDGHGIVSDYTRRDKRPGERILINDRGSKRYYDVEGTTAIAKRDGWGVSAVDTTGMTPAQITALAVERDFEHLRAWCHDEWSWTAVMVTLLDTKGNDTPETACFGGFESTDDAGITEAATELAEEIAERVGDSLTLKIEVREPVTAEQVASAYSAKMRGKVWATLREDGNFEIRGEGLPSHPDLKEQYPNGWSLLDTVTPEKAARIVGGWENE